MDDRTPLIVGSAQLVEREADPRGAREPLAMLEEIGRRAAEDAGGGEPLLRAIDTCGLVEVIAWRPQNGPALVAERLGARPRREVLTATGGEMGVTLLNHVAERIAAGEAEVAFVAGCNNLRTLLGARSRHVRLAWTTGGSGAPELLGESRWGTSEGEQRYGMRLPSEIYPLFENALRARRGLDPDTHMRRIGELMSRLSEVAAKNPYAWFSRRRSPEELVTPSPENRMIAWPYPKYLNAVLNTDQAAGLIVASAGAARRLGLPLERAVWWWGGAKAEERAWFTSERVSLDESPALRAAARAALARAGVSLDEIDCFDFYSCFPVAVEMACEMLGLPEDDARGFTVTGGLPYAGGPGSAYTLHALAAMCARLRERPGTRGLVTGTGWYLTKHAAAVLASAPPERTPAPAALLAEELPGPLALCEEAAGPARIETYTVVYDRAGAPERGIVIGRLPDGRRFLANPPAERSVLEGLVRGEAVGRAGRVRRVDGLHRFEPS